MSPEISWRVLRVQLWDKGHSFEEIDALSLADLGDVLGYTSERSRIEESLGEREKRLKKGK